MQRSCARTLPGPGGRDDVARDLPGDGERDEGVRVAGAVASPVLRGWEAAEGEGSEGAPRVDVTPTAEAIAAVVAVRDAQPAWGHRKVWATLRARGLRIGRRRVHALVQAHAPMATEAPAREAAPRRGHVVTPDANRRFATDLTTVWTKEDGLVAVALTVDCGCRSVLDVTVTKSQEAPSILASPDRALERAFGAPEHVPEGMELRCDHGPQYTSADARDLCARWGIEQTFAPVGRPTGNAVAERTILTMKLECIWLRDWTSLAELERALEVWRSMFNDERPHQSLRWWTPTAWRAARVHTPLALAA